MLGHSKIALEIVIKRRGKGTEMEKRLTAVLSITASWIWGCIWADIWLAGRERALVKLSPRGCPDGVRYNASYSSSSSVVRLCWRMLEAAAKALSPPTAPAAPAAAAAVPAVAAVVPLGAAETGAD